MIKMFLSLRTNICRCNWFKDMNVYLLNLYTSLKITLARFLFNAELIQFEAILKEYAKVFAYI